MIRKNEETERINIYANCQTIFSLRIYFKLTSPLYSSLFICAIIHPFHSLILFSSRFLYSSLYLSIIRSFSDSHSVEKSGVLIAVSASKITTRHVLERERRKKNNSIFCRSRIKHQTHIKIAYGPVPFTFVAEIGEGVVLMT